MENENSALSPTSNPEENKDKPSVIKEDGQEVPVASDAEQQKGCGFSIPYVFQCSFSDDGKGEASVPVAEWLGSMFATTPKEEPSQIENNKVGCLFFPV